MLIHKHARRCLHESNHKSAEEQYHFPPLSLHFLLVLLIRLSTPVNVIAVYPPQSFITVFLLPFLQCDTSGQGGSPGSSLTCSTASPCSESPTSTLSTRAAGQILPPPLSQCSSSTSPCGTLSSPVSHPVPCSGPGLFTGNSAGPPSQSPTSTLESKDSGIIGESSALSIGKRAGSFIHYYPFIYYVRRAHCVYTR